MSAATGLWPDLSAPVATNRSASKDAALIIGIEQYDALPAVVGAADTAREWERYALLTRRIPPARVRLLTNRDATVDLILARAKELHAEPGGTVFVVFIGHGAPGGLLVGADARASEASLHARSLSYSALAETLSGKAVFVLDACFSGIGNDGKSLLPNTQPVIASSLVASANTTILSAGSALEYAGALPGSQRPALSYLALGALRGWADRNGDGVVTAGETGDYVNEVLRALPNTHEQHPELSTTTPDLPLSEDAHEKAPDLVAIRTKLDTWRPGAAGRLRVAVGCGDSRVLGPDEGLAVYVDDSPAVPVGGPAIEYAITPGKHHVLVRVPGCKSQEIDVDSGAEVAGILPLDTSWNRSGPAGNPSGLRVAASLWVSRAFTDYAGLISASGTDLDHRPSGVGAMVQPGLAFRWWSLGADLGVASGASDTWLRGGLRVGAHFPFDFLALNIGVGGGVDSIKLSNLPAGARWTAETTEYVSGWASLDAHPFCDWLLTAGSNLDLRINDHNAGIYGLLFGVGYQPSATCHAERTTHFGLH